MSIKINYKGKCYSMKFHKLNNSDSFYYFFVSYNKPYSWKNYWIKLKRNEDEDIYKSLFDMNSEELNKCLEENFDSKYILNKLCFHKSDIKRIEEWIESLIIINKLVR